MMIQIHDATFDDTFDYKHQHKQKGGSTTTASKTNMFRASYHYLTYRFQYIYIYCEQNYPCSGYVGWLIVSKSCVLFPAFQLCMAEERALFLAWLGVLSQRGVGEQSLEILQGLLTLYPRRTPICTPHVRYYLNLPNTKDGNLWIYAYVHLPDYANLRFSLPGRSMSVTGLGSPLHYWLRS